MNLDLNDKVVLITGSSRGIGFGIAKSFFDEGARVILNGRQPTQLDESVASMPDSIGFLGDYSIVDDAKRIASQVTQIYGKLDVLVCNVGNGKSVIPGTESSDDWISSYHQNFLPTVNAVDANIPLLRKGKGVIVCISSICGLNHVANAPLTYSSSKAALNSYIKGMSRPLGKLGIRINAVAPGNILFPGSVWERKISCDPLTVDNLLANEVALKSFGTVEDVANATLFLSSSRAKFMTGCILVIDGGQIR